MDFWEWEPYYQQIVQEFGYDRRRDEEAAKLLSLLLKGRDVAPDDLRRTLGGQRVTILGNSQQLPSELSLVEGKVIAADEAVSIAREVGVPIDIIMTDLDGAVDDQLAANTEGSIVIIHAHGDNMEALRAWAGKFIGETMGTTQSRPFGKIRNYGGFTDGDRAAFLATHFGARTIQLLGFDFERPNEKDRPLELKRRKLAWARKLIGVLEGRATILFPSSSS